VKASDVMRKSPIRLAHNSTLQQVIETFIQHKIDLLPIVDAAEHVVGVLAASDLLDILFPRFYDLLRDYAALEDKGQLSSLFNSAFSGLDIAENKLILAADVMRTNLIWVGAEDSLVSAASRLFGQKAEQLPVVDRDRRLMGMISETEVVLALLRGDAVVTHGG
jgi:CBS domain-containing membrane protein